MNSSIDPSKSNVEKSPLRHLMGQNFIEYASYVIKDRAIPDISDGLKPVQRRILHSLYEMDDGKFHKVANVTGNTMKYHPHGDMPIYSALVNLANKDLFIDRQGNFGNELTGDPASAARYIECRLTPLAHDILFCPPLTKWVESYDGRNKEPVHFPCKIPVLLLLGCDGIAVGMSTRILPHNFIEVLKAQIAVLKNESYRLYPDFRSGGIVDISEYEKGKGKVKVRAKIDIEGRSLIVREIPYQTTVESVIQSVEDAARKNKIKISSISDFTSEKVEIEIVLQRGQDPGPALQALYAFTDCEVSINLEPYIIKDNAPCLMTVNEILEDSTARLVKILRSELEYNLEQLNGKLHELTLERIFIENRLYKQIEECKTMELVRNTIRSSFKKFENKIQREITEDNIDTLLSIPIRKITRYDIEKNKKDSEELMASIDVIEKDLKNVTRYTIHWLENILEKHSSGKERRTKVKSFEEVDVKKVALKNTKMSYDPATKYFGSEVDGKNPITCTQYDKILLIAKKGYFKVVSVQDKIYIVDPLCHYEILDKDRVFNVIYYSRDDGYLYAKRFKVEQFILDKEYAFLEDDSKLEYIETGENIKLKLEFQPEPYKKIKEMDLSFQDVLIKNFKAKGVRIIDRKLKSSVRQKNEQPSLPLDDK